MSHTYKSLKDIAKDVRNGLKAAMPECTWSVVKSDNQVSVSQADFPNPSDAVEHARENEFARWESPGVRRVEDSVTCEEVE